MNSVLHLGQTYVLEIITRYKAINRTNTGTTIKYHGTSRWLPNQLTRQEVSKRAEESKSKEKNAFFIITPPFLVYYSTFFGVFQDTRGKIPFARSAHHAEGVNIINSARNCISSTRSVVYHQSAGESSPKGADEIQGRLAALDDIRRTSCVDDIPSLRLG